MLRGNGGWAGSIPVADLIGSIILGYAVAATDDGHTSGQMPDAAWAIGHPEKLIDFGYRAVHETAIHSKVLLHAFYCAGIPKSRSIRDPAARLTRLISSARLHKT